MPLIVYADNYSSKVGNQQITIVIRPNNTIVSNITNNTEEDNRLEKIAAELSENERFSWTEGDVIIASSTIFAFFTFSSFLVIRFKSKRVDDLLDLIDTIITSILCIQIIQIGIIIMILAGWFKEGAYAYLLAATGFCLILIAVSIRQIIHLENRRGEKIIEADATYKQVMDKILGSENVKRTIENIINKPITGVNKPFVEPEFQTSLDDDDDDEDDALGIEKFSKFGQASKAGLGGEIIGQKGLGKLSLLRFGEKVNFRTNNGEIGMDIIMTPQDFEYDIKSATKFLDHQGTRIIIPSPKGVPPVDDLANYLKKVFGLRIAKGTEIILNGVKLESNSKIDPQEKFLFRLSGGKVDVTGNMKEDKKGHGNADLYIRHVLVTSLLVDPERKFSGWVNCNELIPTTSRNDVVRDSHGGIFDDFLVHLKDYVRRFPKVEEEITKDEELLGNELNKMLRNYLSELRILPQGTILIGRGNENTLDRQDKTNKKEKIIKDTPEETPEYVKMHTSRKTNKPIKRTVKTDYGVMWVDQNIGNEKEPIFFVEPNMVIRNRTNDIYKFLVKNKASLGSKPIRAFPYLARVAVSMNKESPKWNREQLFLEMDRAIRYFLKNKGEL